MIRTLKHLFQKAHWHRKLSCSDCWLVAGCSSKLRQLKHVPAVKLTPNVNIDSSEMLEWSCDDSSLATLEQQEQRTAALGKRRLETKWWRSVQQSHVAVALNTDTRSVQIPNVKLCCICSELGLIAMCLQSICIYILNGSYLETHWQPQDNQWLQSADDRMCSPRVWGVARSG